MLERKEHRRQVETVRRICVLVKEKVELFRSVFLVGYIVDDHVPDFVVQGCVGLHFKTLALGDGLKY